MKVVKYIKEYGEYSFPDGLKELLQGKSIKEQLKYFRVSFSSNFRSTYWQDRTELSGYIEVDKASDVKGIIVDNGLIVGAMIENEYGRSVPCFIDEGVCTWYASDNNGAGYKERIEYAYFLAVKS